MFVQPGNNLCMQFGVCLLEYYYSYQVNEIICIEALHKDLRIKFGYITKMTYSKKNMTLGRSSIMFVQPGNNLCMQFGVCLLEYYYSYQVNEIICIEALHKDLRIKFGYITKMAH